MLRPSVSRRLVVRLVFLFIGGALAAQASAKPMTFKISYTGGNCGAGRCSWIAADGEITSTTSAQLRSFLKAEGIASENQWITINSPGGDLLGGLELGEAIRDLKMNVRVGATTTHAAEGPDGAPTLYSLEAGVCESACVFALMGGIERELADEESLVGVHQFAPVEDKVVSERVTTSTAQTIIAVLHRHALRMGVSSNLIGMAGATVADKIKWLPVEVLEATNLITSRREQPEADWELKPFGSALAAFAKQVDRNGYVVSYALTCDTLTVYLPATGSKDRLREVADAIQGGRVEMGSDTGGSHFPLKMTSATTVTRGLLVKFTATPGLIAAFVRASTPLELVLDLSRVYREDVHGGSYLIPRSNLRQVAPHIARACR
jgi:hypothetical protein